MCVKDLIPGSKVRLVNNIREGYPYDARYVNKNMERYAGKVVTVTAVNQDSICILEDAGDLMHWFWWDFLIDSVYEDEDEAENDIEDDEILSILRT